MSVKKIYKYKEKTSARSGADVFWAYLAQGLNIGAGLIMLPLVARYLHSDDFGLWLVFMTLAALAQLLEFGFQPTLIRNVAYVYSGAVTLKRIGVPTKAVPGTINLRLLADVWGASRKIYRVVALVALVVLWGIGSVYITSLTTMNQSIFLCLLAWFSFAAGYVLNFYFGYVSGFLMGRGDIASANKAIVFSRCVFLFLGAVALILGFGLLGLGFANLVSAFVGRALAWNFMYSRKSLEMFEIKNIAPRNYMVKLLWHNSYRMGIVQLGAFLIQRSSLLLASSFLGLSVAASYGMTMTVLLTITAVGMVIMQVSIPKISALQSGNTHGEELVSKYGEILLISWFFYIASAILLIFFAPLFLSIISSKTQLLDTSLLVFSCVIFALELNHTIAATYLTTTNRVPFVIPAILSGVGIVLLGLAFVQWLGVVGLLLSQFIVQLAYNNWKWPLEVQKLLDKSLAYTLQAGWKSITARFFIGRTQ